MRLYDCYCGQNPIKLMTDYEAEGIWCGGCGCALSIDDLDIPRELKIRILDWQRNFDVNCDPFGQYEFDAEGHNRVGKELQVELLRYYRCYHVEEI